MQKKLPDKILQWCEIQLSDPEKACLQLALSAMKYTEYSAHSNNFRDLGKENFQLCRIKYAAI